MKFLNLFILFACLSFLGVSSAQSNDGKIVSDFDHFYETIDINNLSKLYWKMGVMDINDHRHVDSYMLIHECDIYREYHHNEFEWGTVREQAQLSIKNNAQDFANRFKFVQSLKFGEYNFKTQRFEIQDQYKMLGIRQLEAAARTADLGACGRFHKKVFKYYPLKFVIYLNQPYSMVDVPVSPERAKVFVEEKQIIFNRMKEKYKTKASMLGLREVFVMYKVKVNSFRESVYVQNFGDLHYMNGILEGIEIFKDQDLTELIYFKNFLKEKKDKTTGERLEEQYKMLKDKDF